MWVLIRKCTFYKRSRGFSFRAAETKNIDGGRHTTYGRSPSPLQTSMAMLLLMTAAPEGSENKKAWVEDHLTAATLFIFAPQAVLSFWCISNSFTYLGLYVAVTMALASFQLAIGGLKLENGTLGFFGKFKAHASPMTILACGLMFAGAFGAIHYGVWSLIPSEYANMHGWQDALYFSVTTIATVGYGDITPLLHLARWLCTVEIISGFTLLVVAVNASMAVWIQSHQPKDETLIIGASESSEFAPRSQTNG